MGLVSQQISSDGQNLLAEEEEENTPHMGFCDLWFDMLQANGCTFRFLQGLHLWKGILDAFLRKFQKSPTTELNGAIGFWLL